MNSEIVPISGQVEVDLLADPVLYMDRVLGRAVMWLADVERVEDVIHTKATAKAMEAFLREKELAHDAQVSATEIVRRCDRRLGSLVKSEQAAGRVKDQSSGRPQREVVPAGTTSTPQPPVVSR